MDFRFGGNLRRWLARALDRAPGPLDGRSLDQLLRDLAASDDYLAAHAAEVLVSRGEPAVSGLCRLLGHWDDGVRALAAETLARLGEDAMAAVPALNSRLLSVGVEGQPPVATPREVAALARAATISRDPATVKALIVAAGSRRDDGAVAAVVALGEIGAAAVSAVPAIVSQLQPEIGRSIVLFKVASAHALGRIGGPGVEAIKAALVFSPLPADRELAAVALGLAGGSALDPIAKLLSDDHEVSVRVAAAIALGSIRLPGAAQLLRQQLDPATDPRLRAAAVDALRTLERSAPV